jgi:hypothetical protein
MSRSFSKHIGATDGIFWRSRSLDIASTTTGILGRAELGNGGDDIKGTIDRAAEEEEEGGGGRHSFIGGTDPTWLQDAG